MLEGKELSKEYLLIWIVNLSVHFNELLLDFLKLYWVHLLDGCIDFHLRIPAIKLIIVFEEHRWQLNI
jgi:hypothetical protein